MGDQLESWRYRLTAALDEARATLAYRRWQRLRLEACALNHAVSEAWADYTAIEDAVLKRHNRKKDQYAKD